jgi:3-hydroxybutyryl-CoA dehydrogenase
MHNVGVVGFGQMGSGIAEVCARAGLDVLVFELTKSLDRAAAKGLIEAAAPVLERIRLTESLQDMHDRDLVIDAIPEIEQAKIDLFAQLDTIVTSPEAVLAPTPHPSRSSGSPQRPPGPNGSSGCTSSTRPR